MGLSKYIFLKRTLFSVAFFEVKRLILSLELRRLCLSKLK